MADVIAEAGLSAGAIYGHFEGKQELFLAVARSVLARRRDELESVIRQGSPPAPGEALGILLRGLVAGGIDTRVLVQVVSRLFGEQPHSAQYYTANTETLAATKTLVCDDAYYQVLDPGGAGRDVVLPKEAASKGLSFHIRNSADAAEILTIKASDGSTTVCTPTQNEAALVTCDGTTWRGVVGASN